MSFFSDLVGYSDLTNKRITIRREERSLTTTHRLTIQLIKKDFDNVIVKASQKVLYRDLMRMTLEGFGHNWKESAHLLDDNDNQITMEGSLEECLKDKEKYESAFQALGTSQISKIKHKARLLLKRKNVATKDEEGLTQWDRIASYLSLMQIWVLVTVEPLDKGQTQ